MAVEARFKRSRALVFLSGPKGTARLDGDSVALAYDDGQSGRVRFADLKKAGFNSNNGLWTFYPKAGKKLHIQTTGAFLSVGDRAAGQGFNEALADALARHGVKSFSV